MDQASDAVRVLVRIRPSTCEQDPVLNWDANDGTIQIEERQYGIKHVQTPNTQRSFVTAPQPTPKKPQPVTPASVRRGQGRRVSITPTTERLSSTPSRKAVATPSGRKARLSFAPFSLEDEEYDGDGILVQALRDEDDAMGMAGEKTREILAKAIPPQTPNHFTPKTLVRNVLSSFGGLDFDSPSNVTPSHDVSTPATQSAMIQPEEKENIQTVVSESVTKEALPTTPIQPKTPSTPSAQHTPTKRAMMKGVYATVGNRTPSIPLSPQQQNERVLEFSFDGVIPPSSTQSDMFFEVESAIQNVFDGYNSTIMTYGPTGSGKTHTMIGDKAGSFENESLGEGIVSRCLRRIFEEIAVKNDRAQGESQTKLYMTFVELHLNSIRDLLDPDNARSLTMHEANVKSKCKLDIRGDCKNVYLTGSKTFHSPVTSFEQSLEMVNAGQRLRVTRRTNCNDESSRSHTVLTLHIEENATNGSKKTSKINLVDLAGCERLSKSGAEGVTMRETLEINKSLTALADVLSALSKLNSQNGSNLIPYRNSRLTRLLQDSLGGNSRTIMIVCVRPEVEWASETLNALKYAEKARRIQNKASKASITTPSKSLKELQKTISIMKRRLAIKTGDCTDLQRKIEELRSKNESLQSHLDQEIMAISKAEDGKDAAIVTLVCQIKSDKAIQQLSTVRLETQQLLKIRTERRLRLKAFRTKQEALQNLHRMEVAEAAVGKLQAQYDVRTEELNSNELEISQFREQQEKKEFEIQELRKALKEMKKEVSKVECDKNRLQNEKDEISTTLEKTEARLERKIGQVKALQVNASRETQSKEIEELNEKAEDQAAVIKDLKRKLQRSQEDSSKKRARDDENEELNQKIRDMQRKQKRDAKKMKEMSDLIESLEAQEHANKRRRSVDAAEEQHQEEAEVHSDSETDEPERKAGKEETAIDCVDKKAKPKTKVAPAKKTKISSIKAPAQAKSSRKRALADISDAVDEEELNEGEDWDPSATKKAKGRKRTATTRKTIGSGRKNATTVHSDEETVIVPRKLLPVGTQAACVLSPVQQRAATKDKSPEPMQKTVAVPRPKKKATTTAPVKKAAAPPTGNDFFASLFAGSFVKNENAAN